MTDPEQGYSVPHLIWPSYYFSPMAFCTMKGKDCLCYVLHVVCYMLCVMF